jgi:hypothetical protein
MGGGDGPVTASVLRLVALGVLVDALLRAPSALAQVPAASPPVVTRGDASAVSGFRLSAPLVLSLEASVFPLAGAFPNCASREEDAGNSVGGIPVHHYVELRLTPRLVLSGFSQLGCPIDGGVGAAFTYAVPVRESTWLVFGGGVYGVPGQVPLFGGLQTSLSRGAQGRDSPVQMTGRIDVVWKTKDEHPYSLGIQALGKGRQQVMFGSGF